MKYKKNFYFRNFQFPQTVGLIFSNLVKSVCNVKFNFSLRILLVLSSAR